MSYLRGLGVVIVVIGLCFIGGGYAVKAKAVVAQILLHSSWEVGKRSGIVIKPWPWADTYPVARLIVERLGVDQIVQEGDSGATLAFGPGHFSESVIPPLLGNTILAGHRDTSFSFLQKVELGEVLHLEDRQGVVHQYSVVEMMVVDRNDLYFDISDTNWLTLITCYPFDSISTGGPLRYVVAAQKIDNTNYSPSHSS